MVLFARVQASISLSFLIKSLPKEREDCRSIKETALNDETTVFLTRKNKNVRFAISQPILGRLRREKTQQQWKRHYLALFKTIFGIRLRQTFVKDHFDFPDRDDHFRGETRRDFFITGETFERLFL